MNPPPGRAKSRLRKVALVLAGLLGTGMLLGTGAIVGVFWYYGRGIEGIDVAAIREYRPPQVTRIVSRDGAVIGEIFSERRTLIRYEDIPTHVENAFLAAEDADFYNHEGMDYLGMVRAMLSNIEAGEIRQGASTITQQVVKNFLLTPERTFERKIQEILLARRLERALTKKEILELYLNEIYFGHGRYGIEEASRFYFSKSVRDISLGQAALLASLPKAPGKGSPLKDPKWAKERQIYVLKQMVRHGWALPQDAEAFIDAPLELSPQKQDAVVVPGAQEFVDAAREKLVAMYGQERLDRLGAVVTTTVDLELQAKARAGLLDGLVALDHRQGYGHKIKPTPEKQQAKVLEKGRVPLHVGAILPGVIQPRTPDIPADAFVALVGDTRVLVRVPEGSRYDDPKLSHDEQFPPTGVTMIKLTALPGSEHAPQGMALGEIGSGPQAALLLASVETGEILAMIGGDDYHRGEFNR
ncbi:MAG TPA: transglycosylase domain-containing protein, partial [Nannocystis sp.]